MCYCVSLGETYLPKETGELPIFGPCTTSPARKRGIFYKRVTEKSNRPFDNPSPGEHVHHSLSGEMSQQPKKGKLGGTHFGFSWYNTWWPSASRLQEGTLSARIYDPGRVSNQPF